MGNIVGHATGVDDLGSLSSWTSQHFDPRLSWADGAWVKERWGSDRPLILKGIMDADDARAAVAHGADALVVSNHGGRQLDGAPSSITALPAIVDAVGSAIEIHMDGGVRITQNSDGIEAGGHGESTGGTSTGLALHLGLGMRALGTIFEASKLRRVPGSP